MSILREEDNQWESTKNWRRLEVSTGSQVAQSGAKRIDREQDGWKRRKKLRYDLVEDDWGQVKTTQNGEKKDMEAEENGSKDESRWEQSNMSEGAADPYGMGAISHAKP